MTIPEISPYLPTYTSKPQITNPILQPTPVQNQFLPKRAVEYVKGYEGAQSFALAPGSSALVLDEDQNVLWVIATDQNGNKSVVKGYQIGAEYIPPKPATLDDLMAQMKSINERLNKIEEKADYGQHDHQPSDEGQSNGSSYTASGGNGAELAVGKFDNGAT